eukprot:gene44283-59076_t
MMRRVGTILGCDVSNRTTLITTLELEPSILPHTCFVIFCNLQEILNVMFALCETQSVSSELQILLVEDNEHLREEMLDFLNRPGWVACAVGSGVEVDQHLVQNTPNVVLLDVNLPHEDGFSITARLRATYPDIGIVLLTARVHPADRAMGYKAGADVYLTKPTHTGELLAVLNNLGRRVKPVEVIQYF